MFGSLGIETTCPQGLGTCKLGHKSVSLEQNGILMTDVKENHLWNDKNSTMYTCQFEEFCRAENAVNIKTTAFYNTIAFLKIWMLQKGYFQKSF